MALEPIRLLDASNSREMLDASNSRELHGGVDWIASDFGDGDQLVEALEVVRVAGVEGQAGPARATG